MKIISFLMILTLTCQTFSSAWAGTLETTPQTPQKAEIQVKQEQKVTETQIEIKTDPSGFDPFGINLFRGNFSRESFTGFNPDYQIALGDQIVVRLWGATEFDQVLTVDPQGNVFIPKVGPVRILNVRNQDLNQILSKEIEKVYLKNVGTYTSLNTNQPVKVYVSGFVTSPGLYSGLNTDSIMSYIDKASGITPSKGSYRDIVILRNNKVLAQANLYDFILEGRIPPIQFHDGDTILVNPRGPTVRVTGLVQNRNTFEIGAESVALGTVLKWAKVLPESSHVRLIRNHGNRQSFEYFSLDEAAQKTVIKGDVIEVVADKQKRNIAVRVEGEHNSAYEYVVSPGTSVGEILRSVELTSLSDVKHVQLFRKSVKETQNERIKTSLDALQNSILGASSASKEEAEIRAKEAEMLLKLIEKARTAEPKGQVVLTSKVDPDSVLLEYGDVIVIPQLTNVVLVNGEVMFPNAIIHRPEFDADDYIEQAGGYTRRADRSQTIVLHRDGSFETQSNGWFSSNVKLQPGDEVFILPEVDTKSFQMTKDIVEILYHLAVTTKVVLTL